MSAHQEPDSPKITLMGWAACLFSCWLTMQVVGLAIMLAGRAGE